MDALTKELDNLESETETLTQGEVLQMKGEALAEGAKEAFKKRYGTEPTDE